MCASVRADLDQLNLILNVLGTPSKEDFDAIINDKVLCIHVCLSAAAPARPVPARLMVRLTPRHLDTSPCALHSAA